MSEEDYIVIECPHCQDSIIIYKKQIRCRIFRHAVYKNSGRNVNPHLSQNKCEALVKSGKIFGCCKPLCLNRDNKPEICDYI